MTAPANGAVLSGGSLSAVNALSREPASSVLPQIGRFSTTDAEEEEEEEEEEEVPSARQGLPPISDTIDRAGQQVDHGGAEVRAR